MTATQTVPAWASELPKTMPNFLFADFGDPDNRKQDVKPGLYNLLVTHVDHWEAIRARCVAQGIDEAMYEEAVETAAREIRIESERDTVAEALLAVSAHVTSALNAITTLTDTLDDTDISDSYDVEHVKAFLKAIRRESAAAYALWPFTQR